VDSATAVAVQMTAYSTTLLADGKDKTLHRITVIDSDGHEITSATNSLQIYVDGVAFITGAESDSQTTNSDSEALNTTTNNFTRITKSGDTKSLITAVDTSGRKYLESKLKNGLCLLDFHAGTVPGKIKVEVSSDKLWPASHEIHAIPANVTLLTPSKDQLATSPRKIGNEVNHGILWPDGHISNLDNLAELLKAGAKGALTLVPDMPIMMHLALGGQNKEAIFWLDNMIACGLKFDVIGITYYPRWHGTLDDLKFNLTDLASRYKKPLNIVEYTTFKKEVYEIILSLHDSLSTGTCIWDPLSPRWGGMFSDSGQVLEVIRVYDKLWEKYLTK